MKKNPIRNEIMETASRLFYKQGYNGTGINQIIDEAGIAKASLYQNFKSKEDLLADYLDEAGRRVNTKLNEAISEHDEPVDKIMAIFDFWINRVQEKDYHGCRFLNIVSEVPEENIRIRSQVKAQKNITRNMFREILKPIEKENLTDELYILFEGALIANKIHGEVWPIEAAKSIVKKLV